MPWALITFLSDLRGTYPFGGDNLLFPTKSGDRFVFRVGGGRMFHESYEAFASLSYRSVSVGARYYGTGDSLFSDYSLYVAVRYGGVGMSATLGSNFVGSYGTSYGGAVLSVERGSTPMILRVSAGYVATPLLAAEVEFRRRGAGVRLHTVSRPGIYTDLAFYPYVEMGDITVGGMYRTSGNTFGLFVTLPGGPGRFSLLLTTHEALGESAFSDNLIVL